MKSSKRIRKEFIRFFENNGHRFVPSSPVIPINDGTLLFTNAGMNQFKDIFLGKTKPNYKRAVNYQKCIRAGGKHNDLKEVGKDSYHHTFFEMLGNWSFGDYYKKEAILWAWELLTSVWNLPKDRLFATVHTKDSQAYEIWEKFTDINKNHIEYHPDKYNFWEMGEIGPCGGCSEIHYDRGKEFCSETNKHKCCVNGTCGRYIEIWNLVFIEYNRNSDGKLQPLKQKFVDTGAGFERICQILQEVDSNYKTDIFIPIIDKIEQLTDTKYSENELPFNVIADHIRALCFSIADGGYPASEGRGYVIRRILRRAARFGKNLYQKEPFIYKLTDVVIDQMSEYYSYLKNKKELIKQIIFQEEDRFNLTLERGLEKFDEIVKRGENFISGKDIFLLYDTFGFPVELTQSMAAEKGLACDMKSFGNEMKKQKQMAQKTTKFSLKQTDYNWNNLQKTEETIFVGYDEYSKKSNIVKYHIDGDNIILVLDKTPFYAESGGQIADGGVAKNMSGKIFINDVQKDGDIFLHFGKLNGSFDFTKTVKCQIDEKKRELIKKNHTATHILHKVLVSVFGEYVMQKGSLVTDDKLRFDYSLNKPPTKKQLNIVEKKVNDIIRKNLTVSTKLLNIDDAKKSGAVALFGEKYKESVRVVFIGDFSKEFCGGTHVNSTGEIGLFKITKEGSIASGIRRIEAVCGSFAQEYYRKIEKKIEMISQILSVPEEDIEKRIKFLLTENREFSKKIKSFEASSISDLIKKSVKKSSKTIKGVKLVISRVDYVKNIKEAGDILKSHLDSGIGVIFSVKENKVSVLVFVTKDINLKADILVNKIATIFGGRGGGNSSLAVAGGKNINKIDDVISSVPNIVEKLLNC